MRDSEWEKLCVLMHAKSEGRDFRGHECCKAFKPEEEEELLFIIIC